MYLGSLIGCMILLQPVWAQAPFISSGGVTNAASYKSATTGIAQGSYFVIYGGNLGAAAGPANTLPLQTKLGNTQVNVRSIVDGKTYAAYMYYVSPTQLAGILPSTVPVGAADVTIAVGTTNSVAARIQVVKSSFGIFTISSIPNGQAIIQNYEAGPPVTLTVNQYQHPARPGQTLILWGTGLGPYTAGPDNAAPNAGNIADNVEVLVGGLNLKPFYAGRAPGIPGIDQINFTLPADGLLPDGCVLPIQIRVGQETSNLTTFAKSTSGGVCAHPFGLSSDMLRRLDAGETLKIGFANVSRTRSNLGGGASVIVTHETTQVYFSQFNAGSSPLTYAPVLGIFDLAPGACIVMRSSQQPGADQSNPVSAIVSNRSAKPMDAGQVTLEGAGKSKPLVDGDGQGSYSVELATGIDYPVPIPGAPPSESFLADGNFSYRATGGRVVSPFNAQFPINGLLTMSATDQPVNLRRGQPLPVKWSGGGNTPQDFVSISGFGAAPTGSGSEVVWFQCRAQATDRSFTVPADVTSQIPSGVLVTGLVMVASVPASGRFSFTAPMVGGGNLDFAQGQITATEQWSVFWQ
jgi:uncharacterized protein (TIGR03437 family)